MTRFRQFIKDESGQAMIAALVCLVLGGLIITPLVSYAGTSVHGVSLKKSNLMGLYAADAGIEKVLWSLKNSIQPPTSLSQDLNGMTVTINTVTMGSYTLVAGDWVTAGAPHSGDLEISTSMVWDEGAEAYKYTITCAWSGAGLCKLIEVGARLPLGYDYEAGSAASFGENLSTAEPSNQTDGEGAHMLAWSLDAISIETRTQIFYVTGSGTLEGDYGWAKAQRDDVGSVGELTGTFYVATATATKGGAVAGKIEADVMLSGSSVCVTSWRISK